MTIAVGSIVEGVISGITNFGAFVELPGGLTGLVHISEVAEAYVRDVRDYLNQKDKVKVKVIAIDDKGKIGLSIKQAMEPAQVTSARPVRPARPQKPALSFEERLAKFSKDSDERLQDLKRSTESKRGGRGSSRR